MISLLKNTLNREIFFRFLCFMETIDTGAETMSRFRLHPDSVSLTGDIIHRMKNHHAEGSFFLPNSPGFV